MASLNIVELIEKNPITKLSGTYNNRLLAKIKERFIESEQQLFVASFYCFLNYTKNDFVIDLDNIWEWLGFCQKVNAKKVLQKNFLLDVDYKIMLCKSQEQTKRTRGGSNKETIMLNVRTFKLLCLKSGTKKADQIHEYYVNLEETLQEVIQEETSELKVQLEKKNTLLEHKDMLLEQNRRQFETCSIENELQREKTILEQFPKNTQCVYYGIIDDTNTNLDKFIKFGNSNDLVERVKKHKHTFTNFRLAKAFKVDNKLHVENGMKTNALLSEKRRTMNVNGSNQTELFVLGDMSLDTFNTLIKEIIKSIEYSPENFVKLLEEHTKLKKEHAVLLLKYNVSNHIPPTIGTITSLREIMMSPDKNVMAQKCRKYQKLKDGLYHIDGNTYPVLTGTREQVFNGHAYRTSGLLIKSDLVVGGRRNDKIVSANKCIASKIHNRLHKPQNPVVST
jgi:MSV199 domain